MPDTDTQLSPQGTQFPYIQAKIGTLYQMRGLSDTASYYLDILQKELKESKGISPF